MRTTPKLLITAAVIVALIGTGSAAFAWWSSTSAGTGTGATSSTASNTVTVNQTAMATTLAPGGSVPLNGTFSNSGTTAATVTTITVTLASVTQTSGAATAYPSGCSLSDYSLVQPSAQATPFAAQSIATGAANGSWAATVQMVNKGTNQTGCVGATLAFTYVIS